MPVGFLTLIQAQQLTTVFHSFAISMTIFRLVERIHSRRMWWDDLWAFFALIADILYMVTIWLRNPKAGKTPWPIREKYITLHWFTILLAPTIVWFARISIVLTIKRILPPGRGYRRVTLAMLTSFAFMWLLVISEKIYVCTRDKTFHGSPSVTCFLGNGVPITELICNLLADGLLIAVPVHALWRIRLPQGQRRMVLSVFASSIFTLLASIVQTTFTFGSMKWKTFIMVTVAAHIEATVSLMVCNLLVIVGFFFRMMRQKQGTTTAGSEETEYVAPWGGKRDTMAKTVSMSFPAGRGGRTETTYDLNHLATTKGGSQAGLDITKITTTHVNSDADLNSLKEDKTRLV